MIRWLVIALLWAAPGDASPAAALYAKLDTALTQSAHYEQTRLQKIATLKELVQGAAAQQDYTIRYNTYQLLIDQYWAYQFDSTHTYLYRAVALAQEHHDFQREAESKLRLVYLYAMAGMHAEGTRILGTLYKDAQALSPQNTLRLHQTRYRLNKEIYEYTIDTEAKENASREIVADRQWLLFHLLKDSWEHLDVQLDEALAARNYNEAKELVIKQLSLIDNSQHAYAITTYMCALVCALQGEQQEANYWYAESALTDLRLGVKDCSSLTVLAVNLFNEGQIDRSFSYIMKSLENALFYNARLRPWQVAAFFPMIEQDYLQRQTLNARRTRIFTLIVSALVLLLLGTSLVLARQMSLSRKAGKALAQSNKDLRQLNEDLRELNKKIAEANRVKEEYIGLFLVSCSEYIDKLKRYQVFVRRSLVSGRVAELKDVVSSNEIIDNEVQDFYKLFDTTFLSLYPQFVHHVNQLLVPEARIELKSEELLNTELRILALIRLGITDSSRMATLLRYSVNTIYNYRAKIRNSAKGPRQDFEDQIKSLGSTFS